MTLRVLHVCTDLRAEAGGIAAVLRQLHDALSSSGIVSRMVTYEGALDPGTDALTVPRQARWRSQATPLTRALAGESMEEPLIIHSHGLWDPLNSAAVSLARRRGNPVIISLHGMLLPGAIQQKRWRKWLGWRLFQARDLCAAARIHVTSDDEAESLRTGGIGTEPSKIPFGVRMPPPIEIQPAPRPPFRVIFLGRIASIKNLDTLIAAWAEAGLGPDWRLEIVGPDEFSLCQGLRAQARAAGIGAQVRFPGPVFDAEKWRILRAAAALILPSHSENFGAAVVEALACGVPVIASTGTRWSDLPREGCGWMATPDRDGIAATLSAMAALSVEERAAMGARGARYVARSYAWDAVGARFGALYRAALSQGAAKG